MFLYWHRCCYPAIFELMYCECENPTFEEKEVYYAVLDSTPRKSPAGMKKTLKEGKVWPALSNGVEMKVLCTECHLLKPKSK